MRHIITGQLLLIAVLYLKLMKTSRLQIGKNKCQKYGVRDLDVME